MYKKESISWLKHLDFIIMDIVFQIGAFIFAGVCRLGWSELFLYEPINKMLIVLILIDIVVLFFVEPYKHILKRNKYQELKATVIHGTTIFLGIVLYMYTTKQSELYSRTILFLFWMFVILFEFVGHLFLKKIVRKHILNSKDRSNLLVVTTSELATACLNEFAKMEYTEFKVTGVVILDKPMKGDTLCGVQVVANAEDFLEYVRLNVVDEVFINGNARISSEELAKKLVEFGITVHFNLVHESENLPNQIVERCGNYLVLTSTMKIASPKGIFFKRILDICGSLVGLFITGIAILIFAPIIKKQSPGPLFFRQTRIGRNGRRFKIYKFRSMNVNAEEQKKELLAHNEMQGNMFKMENDPRIFPIGKVMRKYSIDELPQFWNILRGDMSMVGTRPPTEEEFENYQAKHKARLAFKPGLTGMWQISGRSDITDFEEVVALDTYYITHWTPFLDIKIILKTIQVVFSGRGSK